MSVQFIPGRQLAEQFFRQAVRPLLAQYFPALRYAAARIDGGSEVLGFDDAMSTDHDWGPRLMLFLEEETHAREAEAIRKMLAEQLPYEFLGYPTSFSEPDAADNNAQLLEAVAAGPVNHRVTTHTIRGFLADYLAFDVEGPLEPADWLTFSEQRLRTLTAGAIYEDNVGLGEALARFSYYPRDVWLYLLAAGWARIGQEEHLMGRAGMVGDELGAAIIGARLVRDVMRLCFLMERRYAPYPKWFGSAFRQLACAGELWPVLQRAVRAGSWPQREEDLVAAYEYLARMHNGLQLTPPIPEKVVRFHNRPFRVIAVHGFDRALCKAIQDPMVRKLAEQPLIGGIDQFSDSTELLSYPVWRRRLRRLYT